MNMYDDIGKHETSDEVEQDRLIFPVNVHDSLKASAGLKNGEKAGIAISLWLFGCAIIGWALAGWLRPITTHYALITLLVEVALQLTVGVYVLRFVLDEKSTIQEVTNAGQSFANYFKIYREIIAEDGSPYPFDVIEFQDGSLGVFLECRLGHNTQRRSNNTYEMNKEINMALNRAGLCKKTIYHTEDFKSSEAANDLRATLENIKDPKLFQYYRTIVQNYLDIAEDESNVMCVTHVIYAQSRIQKDDLVATVNRLFTSFEAGDTAFRTFNVMKYDEIVEFLRRYYCLEVLDMGLIRASNALRKNVYNCPVTVLKLYGKSGKTYTKDEFNKLNDNINKEFGLECVNKKH